MNKAAASGVPWRLPVLLLIWCGLVGGFVFGSHRFLDPDDYFHVAVARQMLAHGYVLKTFPWVTESVWVDHYFDKEWLFHVLLAWLQPLGALWGAKTFIVLLNALVVLGLWYLARRLWTGSPFWWLLILPVCVLGEFWQRLLVCRPHLLSLALLCFCLGALLRGRHWLLGALTFIYAWSYTGHWQLLGLAGLADVIAMLWDEDGAWRGRPVWRRWPATATVFIAMVAAACLHPHFPANVTGLYLQNVKVLQEYWQGGSEIMLYRPLEIRALPLGDFIRLFAPLLAALAAIAIHALRTRARQPRVLLLFAAYTALYDVMTLKSQRFLEYFVPIGFLFVAAYLSHHRLLDLVARPLVRRLGVAALVVFALYGLIGAYLDDVVRPRLAGLDQPQYAGATAWLRTHLQPGEPVFNVSWSDTPMLFYGAPEQKYLVFLDLFFMYAHSPERFREWNAIRSGQTPDPVALIQRDFHSRIVHTHVPTPATTLVGPFYEQLSRNPAVQLVYGPGPDGDVLFLLCPTPLPPTPAPGP